MLSQAKFILSKSKLNEQYKVASNYADIVSYSFKTNQIVGKELEQISDCMFSVHSIQSVEQLKHPERIWFFTQAPSKKELKILYKKNINKFVVDNKKDLKILLNYVKEYNFDIELLLRMKLKEHTIHTGKHFVYGMYSSQVNELLKKLKNNSNIKKLGIHFHRKTQNTSEWSLKQEIKESIETSNLQILDYINIGGGIPSVYKNYSPKILEGIFSKILDLKKSLTKIGIKMIIECKNSPTEIAREYMTIISL